TDCTAAPCSDDNRMRRSALPKVTPKPRSSGSATTVAARRVSTPALTCNLFGLISSCQFFWIVTLSPIALRGAVGARTPLRSVGSKLGSRSSGGRCCISFIGRRSLYAPPLARAAAIVRNRGHVADRGDGEAGSLQRAQRRFPARARARHLDFKGSHPMLLCLFRRVFGGDLRGIGGRLARALETHGPRRRPGN